jgi:hypothetical protein
MSVSIVFLDDRFDPNHRPHHIYRCIFISDGCESIHCVAKENDHQEGEFLQSLQPTPLQPFLPFLYGIHTCDGEQYIIMNDLNGGYASPCLADFKIGTRHWDIDCNEPFRSRLIEKNGKSTSATLGLRLVSVTLFRKGDLVENTTKSQNLTLNEKGLQTKITKFIPPPLMPVVNRMLVDLKTAFVGMLDLHPNFRIYSGSILLAYDADNLDVPPRLVLIDFAHAHFDIGSAGGDSADPAFDDGVLLGIETFVRMTSRG